MAALMHTIAVRGFIPRSDTIVSTPEVVYNGIIHQYNVAIFASFFYGGHGQHVKSSTILNQLAHADFLCESALVK